MTQETIPQQPEKSEREQRIDEVFNIFDSLMPREETWEEQDSYTLHVLSNNPSVNGRPGRNNKNFDEKYCLFNPSFAVGRVLRVSSQQAHAPAKVAKYELFKVRVVVFDELGEPTFQFRRIIIIHDKKAAALKNSPRTSESNKENDGTSTFSAYVLHEPQIGKEQLYPRRIEYGVCLRNIENNPFPTFVFTNLEFVDKMYRLNALTFKLEDLANVGLAGPTTE